MATTTPAPPAPAGGRFTLAHYAGDVLLWACWLAWAAVWWNRGIFPNDEGWEPTTAYLILRGWRPYVDFIGASANLTGIALFTALIAACGFKLWVFRAAFIGMYGACAWVLYRLLRDLTGARVALAVVIPTVLFFANALAGTYFWYNWHGVLYTLLAVGALARALRAEGPRPRIGWAAVAGVCTVAALFCKPTFGIALGGGIGLTLCAARLATPRIPSGIIAVTWAGATAAGVGAACALLARLGLWEGFRVAVRQVLQYSQVRQGQATPLDTLAAVRYLVAVPRSAMLVPVLLIATGLMLLWMRRRTGPAATRLLVHLPRVGLALCALAVLTYPVTVLQAVAPQNVLLRAVPLTLFVLLPCVGWHLARTLRTGDPAARQRALVWLALGSTGFAFWIGESLVHPRGWIVYIGMTIVVLPVTCAYLLHVLRDEYGVRRGWAWLGLWGVALALSGAATRAGAPYRERPYWEPYPYAADPALRHLRMSNAPEVDRMLAEARRVVEAGGTVFVYPEFFMLYPLVGAMPPTRILNFYPGNVHAPSPAVWREAAAALEARPPDLLILQTTLTAGADRADRVGLGQRELSGRLYNWRANPDNRWGPYMPTVIHNVLDAAATGAAPPGYRLLAPGPTYLIYERIGAAAAAR